MDVYASFHPEQINMVDAYLVGYANFTYQHTFESSLLSRRGGGRLRKWGLLALSLVSVAMLYCAAFHSNFHSQQLVEKQRSSPGLPIKSELSSPAASGSVYTFIQACVGHATLESSRRDVSDECALYRVHLL